MITIKDNVSQLDQYKNLLKWQKIVDNTSVIKYSEVEINVFPSHEYTKFVFIFYGKEWNFQLTDKNELISCYDNYQSLLDLVSKTDNGKSVYAYATNDLLSYVKNRKFASRDSALEYIELIIKVIVLEFKA